MTAPSSSTASRSPLADPHAARDHGIETVYQDLALAPELEPAMNIYLGREIVRSGRPRAPLVHRSTCDAPQTAERLSQLGIDLPRLNRPVSYLSGGQRQAVAIARALIWARRILLLDEPTAALGVRQSRQVHDVIRRVRDHGVTVVLISHNIADVMSLTDRIIAMRLGPRGGDVRDRPHDRRRGGGGHHGAREPAAAA